MWICGGETFYFGGETSLKTALEKYIPYTRHLPIGVRGCGLGGETVLRVSAPVWGWDVDVWMLGTWGWGTPRGRPVGRLFGVGVRGRPGTPRHAPSTPQAPHRPKCQRSRSAPPSAKVPEEQGCTSLRAGPPTYPEKHRPRARPSTPPARAQHAPARPGTPPARPKPPIGQSARGAGRPPHRPKCQRSRGAGFATQRKCKVNLFGCFRPKF